MLLCAATLLLKLLVPTGYMVGSENGHVAIELCSGVVTAPIAGPMAGPMTAAMPGMLGDMPSHGKSQNHGKMEMPCAFAGLSAASLRAVDSVQLAALIAFVFAFGLAPVVLPTIIQRGYLRPPLRGPTRHPLTD